MHRLSCAVLSSPPALVSPHPAAPNSHRNALPLPAAAPRRRADCSVQLVRHQEVLLNLECAGELGLEASAELRRKRRRALIRMLAAGRNASRSLLLMQRQALALLSTDMA